MTIAEGLSMLLSCSHRKGCGCADAFADGMPDTPRSYELTRAIVYLSYQIQSDWVEALAENAACDRRRACPDWIRIAFESPAPSEVYS